MTGTPAAMVRRICLLLVASLWLRPGLAADAAPAINVSEICTTCKDVIRCVREAGSPVPAEYPVVVYYLHEHTTWEQVVTIWEYLVRFGKPKQQDTRELTIFEFPAPEAPAAQVRRQLRAELDAVKMTVEMPGAVIDRTTGDWLVSVTPGTAPTQRAGSCRLLPVADGFAFLRSNTPGS